MTLSTRALAAAAALAVGVGVSACSSETSGSPAASSASPTSGAASPSAAAPTPSPTAPAPIPTLAEYIKQNNITETPVAKGDPGAPTVTLPPPQGWEDMGPNTPPGAYSAIAYTADPAAAQNPPTVVLTMTKLTGNVDPAKVLEVAPGSVRTYPGFEGPPTGQPGKLGGFDATVIGGTYPKDGMNHLLAQKTVVIPGQDGLYVLQLLADGSEDQASALMQATSAIDQQATITP
jgi:hypothetical protein